ncbi:MAG TPA: LysR family transcriptional regulator [Dongiaceae bacterium]|nr:LysR family transcriptional regulator [Dongiaceae bacterium]
MNTRDIEAFLAVVDTGSIVGAASRLHLTQPGVTRRVQNLEQSLGIDLLDRQSKPLKPTAAGREAYALGRRVVASVEDLKSGLKPDSPPTGDFRVGLTPFLNESAVAGPFDRLRELYPQLTLRISSGWSMDLMEQLREGRLDACGIFVPTGMEPPETLSRDHLGTLPALVVAGRSLGLPAKVTLRDIARQPWVLNQDGCGFRRVMRRALELEHLPFNIAVEVMSPELRLSLVARGLGLGITTGAALESSPLKSEVQVLEVDGFDATFHGWLVHRPPAGRLEKPIACLVEGLSKAFRLS